MSPHTVMLLVMLTILIVFAGLFAYLLLIDRSLRRLERADTQRDEL